MACGVRRRRRENDAPKRDKERALYHHTITGQKGRIIFYCEIRDKVSAPQKHNHFLPSLNWSKFSSFFNNPAPTGMESGLFTDRRLA
jgi:hypothetical protein